MSSSTPVRGSGFVHAIAAAWSDIVFAQRRMFELNRPGQRRFR